MPYLANCFTNSSYALTSNLGGGVRKVKDRHTNAMLFGFDFLRNATIALMLENTRDLYFVRLEEKKADFKEWLSKKAVVI